jgi:hypothetical protein
LASREGHLAIVELLISHGAAEGWRLLGDADIHAKNDLALCTASAKGNLEVVECLIEHGAEGLRHSWRCSRYSRL